ncbi:hypothetical protein [Hymenobacter arizonensis]|uniref:Uncharacterized protein n=1 Tax=Hymenobacter arizonensis TaxID=1227077 RepID=A0A1I5TRM1_HYMAR|nr:hypothetical protein [Hymenobacter arizonensis]SFP85714.1 hypothetical protein SAMN04515668_0577 [Hymenobacter arizonensis]
MELSLLLPHLANLPRLPRVLKKLGMKPELACQRIWATRVALVPPLRMVGSRAELVRGDWVMVTVFGGSTYGEACCWKQLVKTFN